MSQDRIAGGTHWRLETSRGPVHVWAPSSSASDPVVYVHGYFSTADSAWTKHRLAEQFAASKRDAVFIVPEAPSARGQKVRWTSLAQLLDEVERQTGLSLTRRASAVAHSAGFETVARWLTDPALVEVVLLDALYGVALGYRDWANIPGHRFINIVTRAGTPRTNSDAIAPSIRNLQRVASIDAITAAQREATSLALYIVATEDHMGLVTGGRVLPVLLRRAGSSALIVGLAIIAGVVAWRVISHA